MHFFLNYKQLYAVVLRAIVGYVCLMGKCTAVQLKGTIKSEML